MPNFSSLAGLEVAEKFVVVVVVVVVGGVVVQSHNHFQPHFKCG